jgi:CDP-diacylglycerol--glycerol-3-phosphate 3-phosphatidyltransferase
MKWINAVLDAVRGLVRGVMRSVAKTLNRLTGGRLSPNAVTLIGLFMHVPIAWLIATRHNLWAAGLLVIFGLFDTLDGELARLQKRDSAAGMLLDASTDRMKEVLLYTGAAYSFVTLGRPYMAAWAVAACGASLCVSYVKAKGETAVAKSNLSVSEVNRMFQDGLLRLELRMFLLVIGLLSDRVILAVIVIALLSTFTAFERLIKITRRLNV